MLRSSDLDGGLVVDLGCGSGILARALTDAGYSVLGVDVSQEMLELARQVAPRATFARASLYDVALPACAAVLAIGEGLTYLPDGVTSDLPSFFRRVHQSLQPGGLLIFDVILRSEREPMRYRHSGEGDGWRMEVEVEEDPAEFRLTRRIRIERPGDGKATSVEEVHRVRTFDRTDLEEMLRSEGFTVTVHRSYGARRLAPRRLAFRARKPAQMRRTMRRPIVVTALVAAVGALGADLHAQVMPGRPQIPEIIPRHLHLDVSDLQTGSRLPDPPPGLLPVLPVLPFEEPAGPSGRSRVAPAVPPSADELAHPLYLVDGVIVTPAVARAVQRRIRTIGIHRGEAAARFGVGAGATVIEITTRPAG